MLTPAIRAAGAVSCEHALAARPLPGGHPELINGVHRWAIAAELGRGLVPVGWEPWPRSPAPVRSPREAASPGVYTVRCTSTYSDWSVYAGVASVLISQGKVAWEPTEAISYGDGQ